MSTVRVADYMMHRLVEAGARQVFLLPGGGATLAAFAAYALEKRVAKQPERFGAGAIEGVAAPEAANNAGAQTSFIPMLTLGIPPNAVMALMVGAMTIKGIQPGPQVMTSNPELFWGLIASMWIGNLMLVILNLPLIGIWIKLLTVPYRFLFPAIMAFCCIGLYTLNNNNFDVFMGAAFAVVGYAFYKLGCEPAPMLLGFILGPLMEENLRRALLISRGNPTVFFTRPIMNMTEGNLKAKQLPPVAHDQCQQHSENSQENTRSTLGGSARTGWFQQ